MGLLVVTPAGFEPCVVRLKGGCPVRLDDRVMKRGGTLRTCRHVTQGWHDLASIEHPHAGPLGVPIPKWHSREDFRLQPPRSKRGALYIELRELWKSVPGGICTCDLLIRNQPLFLLSYGDKKCPWQDLHPHSTASETVVSAVGLHGHDGSDTPVLPRAPLASKASECCWLSRIRKRWTCAPVLHRVMWTCKPLARRLRHAHDR